MQKMKYIILKKSINWINNNTKWLDNNNNNKNRRNRVMNLKCHSSVALIREEVGGGGP